MPSDTQRLIESRLDELSANERDASLLRVGGAAIVLTCALWSAYTTYYARLTLRKGYEFLRALTGLVMVVLVYRALTYGARALLAFAGEQAAEAIRGQDRVDDRPAALGIAFALACTAYGVYRLARWCIEPFTDIIEMAALDVPDLDPDADGEDDGAVTLGEFEQ